ncbi:CDP-alcohol phosphatidyltransferase family protein [Kocuria sp.]|uniref:CDP-alcohol phosphatidyltransferase family protein n=1 Tax=Kocuria sp. TaxID=1871328 RepID=UPI0026DF0028|nr:CDP-alcohol phosphatidyltransferase family protein [Kocuria sp.]MDO5618530.1 CDP-alcohol phosphatidyltransferase family protein [Kocuria sp.]
MKTHVVPQRSPQILAQFVDPANLCTLAGLVFTVWGLAGVLEGNLHQGALGIMGSTVCDIGDGFLARAMSKRSELKSRIGGVLDSLVDLAAGGLLGGACFVLLGGGSVFSVVVAVIFTCALACRLAYFTVVGLDGHSFIGVPVVANQLLVAGLLLVPWVRQDGLAHYVVGGLMILTAAANVSMLRVPKPRGVWMALLACVACAIAAAHVLQWVMA